MTKVAIVQTVPQFMNLEASLNRAIELIGEAASSGNWKGVIDGLATSPYRVEIIARFCSRL